MRVAVSVSRMWACAVEGGSTRPEIAVVACLLVPLAGDRTSCVGHAVAGARVPAGEAKREDGAVSLIGNLGVVVHVGDLSAGDDSAGHVVDAISCRQA